MEEELEKVLEKLLYISPCNAGQMGKNDWCRASRTDKKVSAVMNIVSCKLHKHEETYAQMVDKMNEHLPEDVRIFSLDLKRGD